MRLEVLLEGASDMPVVKEVLTRRFGLQEGVHYRLYPHRGRGSLLPDPLSQPPRHLQGLLHQLPAKLRGWSHYRDEACVLVLVDADDTPCAELLSSLQDMLGRLPRRPKHVLFRIAVEETESWFIADPPAVSAAYPRAKVERLRRVPPDAVVGAWERLASALGIDAAAVTGVDKYAWAERIAPHLDLDDPASPSLRKLIEGVARYASR